MIHGESRSADLEAVEAFLPRIQELIEEEQLGPHQIYNADETGLYYRMLPSSTLAQQSDTQASTGFKQSKERLTLLLCTNWEGSHKLKPLLIGKFRSPRCFHLTNMDALPVDYSWSHNAWMTASIFKWWFHDKFVPAVRKHLRKLQLEEKAILLLDNCPAHPAAEVLTSRCKKIRVVFLPKNTTSKIQPMDQGIISTLKQLYRRRLILDMVSVDIGILPYLKSVTIKEVIFKIDGAWGEIQQDSLKKCWIKALGDPFQDDQDDDVPEVQDDDDQVQEFDFLGFSQEDLKTSTYQQLLDEMASTSCSDLQQLTREWVKIDEEVATSEVRSDEEIVDELTSQPQPEPPEEEEEEEEPTPISELIQSAELLVAHFHRTGQPLLRLQQQTILRSLRMELEGKRKQVKVTDFFPSSQ